MKLSGTFQIRATMAAMGGLFQPPGTGEGPLPPTLAASPPPSINAATLAWAGGNNVTDHNPTLRSYQQIVAEANSPSSNLII